MKKFLVRIEFRDVEALTPAAAAKQIAGELRDSDFDLDADEAFTVIAEDGHTSLVKVGE